jgi:hypothetical protein
MKQTILHQADLSGADGMEVISSIVEVEPGTTIPRHFRHGIGVPGAIAGKFTVSGSTKKTQLMVTPIFVSKNTAFKACRCT